MDRPVTAFILASGPSMSQEIADSVRGKGLVIAVSNCYALAPWADALVSMDARWWRHYKPEFTGRKFCGFESHDTERVEGVMTGWNSGLLAIHVATKTYGAKRVVLLGYDMQGTHYFGKHPEPLRNTHTQRFEAFKIQFRDYKPKGVEILNCTPGSELKCYPTAKLGDVL